MTEPTPEAIALMASLPGLSDYERTSTALAIDALCARRAVEAAVIEGRRIGTIWLNQEQARWQLRIAEEITRAGLTPFDASGNESGDPLDFTADQVRAAPNHGKEAP